MTETTFPFGAGEDAAPFEQESEQGGSKRVLVLAGGLVAALAVAAGGFLFLGGSDDVVEEAFVPTTPRLAQAAQPAATTKKIATTPKLPVPFDEDLGRDPFRALYVEPVAAPAVDAADPTLPQGSTPGGTTTGTTAGTSTGGTSTGGSSAGGTSAGGTTSVPVGTGTTTSGTSSDGAAPAAPKAPTAREYALVLKRVYGTGKDQTAEFTIDGRKAVAKVGIRFGTHSEIRLISLQEGPKDGQWTAVLQVGDGEPFDAVTGDTVMVR